eukprot:35736_1
MQCLEQYIWFLSEKQLEKLKHGQKDIFVMSGQEYHYKMKNNNNAVTFELGIVDYSSHTKTGFMLKINDLSSSSTVSGMFSIAVDELKWVSNGWTFNRLSKGQSENIYFFESALLNNLESLTLRISVIFY